MSAATDATRVYWRRCHSPRVGYYSLARVVPTLTVEDVAAVLSMPQRNGTLTRLPEGWCETSTRVNLAFMAEHAARLGTSSQRLIVATWLRLCDEAEVAG